MRCGARRRCAGQHRGDHGQRDRADRQVDVEHPAPRQVVDEEPADQRADHAGHPEHAAEQALVAAAVPGRDDVGDDRLRARQQAAAADALHRAEHDQLEHGLGQPAQRRPDEEDDDRGLEEHLAPVQVAQLAPQRRGHGGRQQVGGHHPRQVGQPVQVAGDRGQRGRHDRLVQRGQQHPEQQRADDDQCPLLAQLAVLVRCHCSSLAQILPTSSPSPGLAHERGGQRRTLYR